MKRLFYATRTLEDAESISEEVHSLGIDDNHFYVFSDDEKGIETHHLHASRTIENTEILSAKKRAPFLALIPTTIIGLACWLGVDFFSQNIALLLLLCTGIFFIARFLANIACRSFDQYFTDVFKDHLNKGEAIIVIDVDAQRAPTVERQLNKHPLASFLADSSNIASPIPN
jgi:hypothetical protein